MANNTSEIQKLYIAYFNRPADPAGLAYWTGQMANGATLTQVQNSFSSSAEYQAIYQGTSPLTLINTLYQNLFGRDGDMAGMLWWANEMAEGRQTITTIAGALASGTTPGSADNIAINAKIAAATAYTNSLVTVDQVAEYSPGAAYEAASAWLSPVVNASTLSAAITTLDATIDGNGVLGSIFTLTDNVSSQTTADITTIIDPVITKETYWGYNPHGHDETGGTTNEGPVDGGVPLHDLVHVITQYLGYQSSVLNLFNTVDTLNAINNITISGVNDQLQGAGFLGENGELAPGFTLVDGNVMDSEGNIVAYFDSQTGDYTGNYEITVTLSDGNTTTAQVQLSQQQFDFINGLLFDAEGNTRLFEVEIKTWPQVELKDQNGNVVEDANGEPILVNLYEYTANGITTKSYTPIVLTSSVNNGGTIEQGTTTAGDDTIVAGRLELLHQAYIDGGAGRNTLEIDAKGYFAQPLQLLNIQEVHVQNLPNIYTLPADPLGSAYDVQGNSSYPDLDPDQWASYTSSIIDLSRATAIDRLVLTEGNYEGLQVGHVEFPGSLTVNGIRNGAVARFEGAFTQDVNLNYGEGLTGPLTVELLIGQITGNLNFAHNTDALHLVSLGGSANSFGSEDIGGRLTNLKISGDAALYIRDDLDGSFQDETPVTIDASENTGGVNLELSDSQNVTFIGSQGNDIFKVDTNEDEFFGGGNYGYNNSSVTIQGGAGDNLYVIGDTYLLNITDGNGNNDYEVDWAVVANISAGNGNNHFQIDDVQSANLVAGNGNNKFEVYAWNDEDTAYPDYSLDVPVEVNITAGSGKNVIDAELNWGIGVANITVGNGGNDIDASGHEINIATGTGTDVIKVLADIIKINSGGGGDTVTIGGWDYDYVGTDELGGNGSGSGSAEWGDDGALVQIDLGSGNSTVILGSAEDYQSDQYNDFPGTSSLTAHEGSYITGANVTLFVNTVADLRAATLTGVTSVVIDDDAFDIGDAPTANQAVGGINAAVLTLTASQFLAIGADNFRVDGAVFNTHGFVKIIVEESTSLTALGVDDLPRNIDLLLEVQDGVTLTMTAEQLHTRVAQNGVTLVNDGNTDTVNGKVVITGGGINFDPFNTSDTVQSVIDGQVYYGGSLSDDFMSGTGSWYNVQVKSTVNGYDRPADAAVEVVLTLDSTGTATLTQGAFESWHQNLEIIGDQDIMFTGAVGLGEPLGVPTNPFDIDFSALEGNVINFTVDNFELLGQGGSITGNADAGYASEVHISIAADEGVSGTAAATAPANSVGFDEPDAGSLHSSGVTRYVVTTIDGPTANGSTGNQATIKLCDTAQDIEVFALRGNYNDTLVVQDAAWGLVFELQGGGTAKAEGPTGSSNVGALVANYEWEHADAVVNLVHSVAGDVRPLHAAGITIDNADSITINGDGTAVTIEDVNGDDVTSLDVNNAGNVTIVDALPEDLLVIDAAGVTGTFSAVVDPADDFSFVGAAGGSTLTFEEDSSFTADDGSMDATVTTIDGGAAGVVLTVGEDSDINLEEATLINVTQVVLGDDAELSLTMAQADEIGAANFVLALGADNATLNLSGLDGEPFALANYAAGIDVGLVTIADLPVVTLHPDTDLTGIGGLLVPEGTVLNLTAAQFQQLGGWAFTGPEGWGSIAGIGGTTDFTVNITDLTQVDVDNDLNGDGDSNDNGFPNFENLNLSQVTADTKTITLAESVTLDASDNLGGFEVIMGDDMTLALADIQQADGLVIGGGSNTTLQFNDTSAGPFESIDASGFSVDTLMILNVLVANRNVDLMFFGLQESVTKVIYNGLGWVDGVTQNVVLVEGTTVDGWVVFNKPEADVEIRDFNLTMEGGTEITGNLRLSASSNEAGLQQMDLQSVTINSNATADDVATDDVVEGTNRYTGETTNIIGGDITSQGTGWQGTYNSVDNDLLNVTINAEQDFILEGDIIFESVTGNDAVTANDDEEATAVLNVNGPADVTIEGDLDTSDSDVDALVVNHAGTGTMDIRLDGWDIDPTDTITINGDAVGVDVVRISDSIDLSVNGSSISNIDQILLENGSNLTLTFDQYEALGSIVDLAVVGDTATISIVGLDNGDVFDATLLPAGITVASITMAAGNVTIDPASDLTGVGQIIVPEGGTLNLTAAQFNQLAGTGSIVGLDVNGDLIIGEYFVNITDLMQSDIANDLNGDGDSADAGEAFDISGIVGATTTLALGEPQVNLALDTVLGSLTALEVLLADGETLGLASEVQADGLVVTGGVNSTLIFQFAPHTTFPGQIDASGYDVTTLKALASGFTIGGNSNVEYSIDDLASSVELRLYADPADLGFLDPTYRVVVIEAGITTPTGLIFNDWDAGDEVRSLTLTLEGDVELNGNLSIPTRTDKVGTLVQQYFDILTINSVGTLPNLIDGNVNTVTVLGAPNTSDNNLLNVAIDATQDLVIDGDIVFNSVDVPDDDAVATLTITGSANVTIQQLVATDVDIDTLNVANDGTGVLTVTGASAAIEGGSIETLTLSGTGDIVLGTNPDVVSEWGITAPTLSVLDASGLSGDLSLGEVKDIDSAAFTFTAGTGVTTMTLTTDALNSTGGDTLPGTADDTIGWNFDFSGAAAGSEFHLGALGTLTPGSILNIDLGANTTLYIDATMDLSDLDLSILQTLDIVLADGAVLTLNAAQADGLSIVAGADTGTPGFTGVVNVVDLGDDPVDLSGIAANIAGDVTLEDDDVTLDVATDLGFFTVALDDIDDADTLGGQTIRFTTVAQAERDIRVESEFFGQNTDGTTNDTDTVSSTNVVWLFTNIIAPVDTSGYDAEIGRLWLSDDLINNEGGLVESLFTTLPSTILRVDFADLTALNILLASNTVNRTVEFVNFTTVGNLTFSDVGANPEEHIQNLTLKLGGEVTIGNILIDDVVAAPGYDPDSVKFDTLTIESHRALHEDDILASEAYLNDNDGLAEMRDLQIPSDPDTDLDDPENTLPINMNTVGNLGVGGLQNVNLMNVFIDTSTLSVEGGGLAGSNGAALTVGTITYENGNATLAANNVDTDALFDFTGANNITVAAISTADVDITGLTMDATGFTAVLDPVMHMDNTETLTITNGNVAAGTITLQEVEGNELSDIDANAFDGTLNLTLSQIDSTNDDSTPGGTNDGLLEAFTFTAGQGVTTMTLETVGANTPQLNTGSEWVFDFTGAAAGSSLTITDDVVFQAGAILTLDDVPLVIEGDVDLTEVVLNISGATTIWVPAGQSLTLTVAQVDALQTAGYSIEGEGTVAVTGESDDTDTGIDTDFGNLQTGTVDLSAITLAATDGDQLLNITANGALDEPAGAKTTQTIIGSANDDYVTVTSAANDGDVNTVDVITRLGADNGDIGDPNATLRGNTPSDPTEVIGDVIYRVAAGTNIQVEANSGFDTFAGAGEGGLNTGDVVQVTAGAEFYADGVWFSPDGGVTLSADSFNNGVAVIEADTDEFIDASAAVGTNGFSLIGDGDPQANALTGSDQDDTLIDGTASDNDNDGEEDTFTGNDGADKFLFNIAQSDVAAATTTIVAVGVDFEEIDAAGASFAGQTVRFEFIIGDLSPAFVTITDGVGGADLTTDTGVASALSAAINTRSDASATVNGTVVTARGIDGRQFDLLGAVQDPAGAAVNVLGSFTLNELDDWLDYADDPTDAGDASIPNDDRTEITLNFTGTVTVGEEYTLTIERSDGSGYEGNYTVGALDTLQDVVDALAEDLNINAGGQQGFYSVGFGAVPGDATQTGAAAAFQIVAYDADQINGGFTVVGSGGNVLQGTSSVVAVSSSSIIDQTDPTPTLLEVDADVITDFMSSEGDTIVFGGLGAGTSGNYSEGAEVADYAAALAAANTAMSAGDTYYLTSTAADQGLLFFDANGDGDADGVVSLLGVNASNFGFDDIVAG